MKLQSKNRRRRARKLKKAKDRKKWIEKWCKPIEENLKLTREILEEFLSKDTTGIIVQLLSPLPTLPFLNELLQCTRWKRFVNLMELYFV